MSAMDKIIGYTHIKCELRQISDILKNREAYNKLGVSAPRGLLLHGDPGVGKSLMAAAVIEESGRRVFVCRKDKPNGDFVKYIKEVFDEAAEHAPSIVLLDDMDKFANGDERHPDVEEYVTVQSCIDEVKEKEVFVLATVNNVRNLPKSLCRAGRFDRVIEVEAPHGVDAERIIAHYLSNKKLVEDVDVKTIARIMDGRSCAELETVINEAGLFAGYERAEYITMEHIVDACMRVVFNVPSKSVVKDENEWYAYKNEGNSYEGSIPAQVAYHEAGHAVVSEILIPDSTTLVCSYSNAGSRGGFAAYYYDRNVSPLYWKKSRVAVSLAGMAAIDLAFGIEVGGNSDDLDHAFAQAKDLVVGNCIRGLHLHKNDYEDSQRLWSEQEQVVASEVERYYRKAKEILSSNKEFFEKVAAELTQKGVLIMGDIRRIKESCKITPVTL